MMGRINKFLLILIFLLINIAVAKAPKKLEKGDLIYRDLHFEGLGGFTDYHVGIYMDFHGGNPYNDSTHFITEQSSDTTKIAIIIDTTLSSFKSTTIPLVPLLEKYHGGKRSKLITTEKRKGILNTARNDTRLRVPYVMNYMEKMIEWDDDGDGKLQIDRENITRLRCDGLTEVVYRINGIKIRGDIFESTNLYNEKDITKLNLVTLMKPTTQFAALEKSRGKGPEITILDTNNKKIPEGGATKDKNIELFVDDKLDGSGIFSLQVYKNNVLLDPPYSDYTHYDRSNTYQLDLTNFVLGDTVSIFAFDQAGNSDYKIINIIKQTSWGNILNDNQIKFSIKIDDKSSGIDKSSLELDLDGDYIDVGDYYNEITKMLEYPNDSTLILSEGYHAWRIIGFDNAGNPIEDDWHTFTIDIHPSQFALLYPTGTINNSKPIISGLITDEDGVKEIYVVVKDVNGTIISEGGVDVQPVLNPPSGPAAISSAVNSITRNLSSSNASSISGYPTSFTFTYSSVAVLLDGNYSYQIIAKDANGVDGSIETTFTLDAVPPSPLTNFTAQSGNGQNTLTWQNPADSDFDAAEIYRFTEHPLALNYETISKSAEFARVDLSKNDCAYTDIGLTVGQTYYYVIYGYDASSQIMQVWNFTKTADSGEISLSWKNPEGISGIKLYRLVQEPLQLCYELIKTQGIKINDNKNTTVTDMGLTKGEKYYYAGFAKDSAGNYSEGVMESVIPGKLTLLVLFDVSRDAVPFSPYLETSAWPDYLNVVNMLTFAACKDPSIELIFLPFSYNDNPNPVNTYTDGVSNPDIFTAAGKLQHALTMDNSLDYLYRGGTRLYSGLEEARKMLRSLKNDGKEVKVLALSDFEDWPFSAHGWGGNCSPEWTELLRDDIGEGTLISDVTGTKGFNALHFSRKFPHEEYEYLMWISGFYYDYWGTNLSKYLNVLGLQEDATGLMKNIYPELDFSITGSQAITLTNGQTGTLTAQVINGTFELGFSSNCQGTMELYFVSQGNAGSLYGSPSSGLTGSNDSGLVMDKLFDTANRVETINNPNISFIDTQYSRLAIVEHPDAGVWGMKFISSIDGKAKLMGLVKGPVSMDAYIPETGHVGDTGYLVGAKVVVSSELSVVSKDVKAEIRIVGDTTLNTQYPRLITLFDDGEHNDGEADDGYFANTLDLTGMEGAYNFKVTSEIETESKQTMKLEETHYVNVKGDAPMVIYLLPKGTTVEESPLVTFEVADDVSIDSVVIKVDGAEIRNPKLGIRNKSEVQNSNVQKSINSYTAQINSILSSGDHTVEIQAWDKAGNGSAPDAYKFTVASQVMNAIDRSGDSNGGKQITRYPLGLNREELDILGVRVYAKLLVTGDGTRAKNYDLGFSVGMGSLPEKLENFKGVIHVYLNTGAVGGRNSFLSGVGAARLANGKVWNKAIVIKKTDSYVIDSDGNKEPLDVQFNQSTKTISFKLSNLSLPFSTLSFTAMSFGYSDAAEDNIMPITVLGSGN